LAGPTRVLFVCTGNSARSQMAEAVLRQLGGATFEPYSAGTNPKGVNPLTIRVLNEAGIDAAEARSKNVAEFLDQVFDYVVTVCDDAREACPVFRGARTTLHWSIPDPAAAEAAGEDPLAVFRETLADIRGRVAEFIPLAVRNRDARVVGGSNGGGQDAPL
jgi:thioredoxin type arsenate reductase